MIIDFGNKLAFDIFHYGQSKKLPSKFWTRAINLLDIMDSTDNLKDLQSKDFPPSLRLHKLKGKRSEEYAIDINKISGWRITFKFKNQDFYDVKIEDYY